MSDELNRVMRKHRSALTRARKTGDPEKIVAACDAAFEDFNQYGWPDCWSLWERAKDDAAFLARNLRDF